MLVWKPLPGAVLSLSKKRSWKRWRRWWKGERGFMAGSSGNEGGDVIGSRFHVVLLDELGEDLLQVRKVHEIAQAADRIVGDDAAAVEHYDVLADLLDELEHVRDIQDNFAPSGEGAEQVAE